VSFGIVTPDEDIVLGRFYPKALESFISSYNNRTTGLNILRNLPKKVDHSKTRSSQRLRFRRWSCFAARDGVYHRLNER